MRIYDFECKDCEAIFERLVKSLDTKQECPYCGSMDTKKREVQPINFELKGIGVYKNGTH